MSGNSFRILIGVCRAKCTDAPGEIITRAIIPRTDTPRNRHRSQRCYLRVRQRCGTPQYFHHTTVAVLLERPESMGRGLARVVIILAGVRAGTFNHATSPIHVHHQSLSLCSAWSSVAWHHQLASGRSFARFDGMYVENVADQWRRPSRVLLP
jgi:hypothetical protein